MNTAMRLACGALVLALAGPAAGREPSVWAAARQPERLAVARARRGADRLMGEDLYLARQRQRQPPTATRLVVLGRARRLLEQIGAAESDDPALRFLLSQVYVSLHRIDRARRWVELAAPLLASVAHQPEPRGPGGSEPRVPLLLRAEALYDLALSYVHLGEHGRELETYAEAIAIEPSERRHAVLLANRAEGLMVLGRIEEAVQSYRRSLAATPPPAMADVGVTTLWGLAVALDRSGDLPAALDHVRQARALDPGDHGLRDEGWFFVPEYDQSWYAALGHWARARATDDAKARIDGYREALRAWAAYLDRAPATDRWIALAARRQRQCEQELRQALRPRR
jgi:tetratricopeptide (TPR) repeat protein